MAQRSLKSFRFYRVQNADAASMFLDIGATYPLSCRRSGEYAHSSISLLNLANLVDSPFEFPDSGIENNDRSGTLGRRFWMPSRMGGGRRLYPEAEAG